MSAFSSKPRVDGKAVIKLRALMARTVANGCTPEEELQAARMVAKIVGDMEDLPATSANQSGVRPTSWAAAEQNSREYQLILERNTSEMLLKAAITELSLSHIHNIAPPRQKGLGEPTSRIEINSLLVPHLSMVLPSINTKPGYQMLTRILAELAEEGAIPRWIDVPVDRRPY